MIREVYKKNARNYREKYSLIVYMYSYSVITSITFKVIQYLQEQQNLDNCNLRLSGGAHLKHSSSDALQLSFSPLPGVPSELIFFHLVYQV